MKITKFFINSFLPHNPGFDYLGKNALTGKFSNFICQSFVRSEPKIFLKPIGFFVLHPWQRWWSCRLLECPQLSRGIIVDLIIRMYTCRGSNLIRVYTYSLVLQRIRSMLRWPGPSGVVHVAVGWKWVKDVGAKRFSSSVAQFAFWGVLGRLRARF